MSNSEISIEPVAPLPEKKIFDWLWWPLHAKIWWSTMFLYWGGMFASLYLEPLSDFYSSVISGFANVLFFPPLMILVLLFSYIRDRLGRIDFDEAPETDLGFDWQDGAYGPSGMLREFDPLDPTSGALWIGNPLNPLNGAYINRHPS
ncbi:hypothetical protein SAMN05518849_11267 [Sphingobium sp. AP50]|uniref:hypothetical protein n=1 Tax=Sphingobium sp. AP50 TaxID=1884369 RepID=UPI0008B9EAAC|nr:hypothetical protein [Sphingobium sp. AP50]SEJ73416.1 hypothetical protein SAMN05518849_11267 [Sphingobium sp. AP50]